MAEIVPAPILAVDSHTFDVEVVFGILRGFKRDDASVRPGDDRFPEQRSTDRIFIGSRADRIESEGGEYVPGGCLAVVLVAAIAVEVGVVELVHHLADPLLRLPRLAAPVVKVEHMLDRLVAVGVIPHIHNLHFPDFVDREAVVAVIEDRWDCEYAVEHACEHFVSAYNVNQALRVVED